MPLLYRIQKAAFVGSILSGEGAQLYGGRWNPVGTPLIYTSTTPELALLEMLVHLEGTPVSDLPPYVFVTLEAPDAIEIIPIENLPAGWNNRRISAELARFLLPRLVPDDPSLGFAVPSVILQSPSSNVLLNPRHSRIGEVRILEVQPHVFDGRL